jgi:hypothetical protein
MYSPRSASNVPGVKPAATRAGTPPIRSRSAMAPENCWQYPVRSSKRKVSSGTSTCGGDSE